MSFFIILLGHWGYRLSKPGYVETHDFPRQQVKKHANCDCTHKNCLTATLTN